jgi:hypothetical protein
MTARRLSLNKHITNANLSENALACVFELSDLSGGRNSLANNFIQVKAQDAQSEAAGTLLKAQRPIRKPGTLKAMQNRKKTNLLTSGEKVAARLGIYLPTRGYQKAKASALQALIFFYLTAVVFGYVFPTVQSNLIQESHFSFLFDLSKSTAVWLLPNPMIDAEACIELADSCQSLLKHMLDVKC